MPTTETLTYGDHASQRSDLTRPAGQVKGTVVVIHGGFWKQAHGLDLGRPLAADLAARGWRTLNVEYRRVGEGGGFPATLDDVAAAIDQLADRRPAGDPAGDPADGPVGGPVGGPVVALGHSAGGHLAAWAAARTRFARWAGGVEVTHVVSQAGVLDLAAAARAGLGAGAVTALMGAGPGEAPDDYRLADPARQLPLDQPLWAVHARDDDTVPFAQSADYVVAANEAGATAELVEVPGGHFGHIDTGSPAWARTLQVFDGLG